MKMEHKKEDSLLSQGSRTPSDRRRNFMIPGVSMSSSYVGPTPLLPTGGEQKAATVEDVYDSDLEDPQDMTFADCASILKEDVRQDQEVLAAIPTIEPMVTSTPMNVVGGKRKAKKSSPDSVTPSDDELPTEKREPRVIFRKLKIRSRKKKPQDVDSDFDADLDSSDTKMSAKSEKAEKSKKKISGTGKMENISTSEMNSDVEYWNRVLEPKLQEEAKVKEWK